MACLRALAEVRGWSPDLPGDVAWGAGALETIEEADFVHSSLAALQGRADLLDRRIWQAEVAVLFPFLEQSRLDIVSELSGELEVPFETPFGTVTDARDLELGQILRQLQRRGRAAHVFSRIERLTRVRHALAHGEPARPEDALALVARRLRSRRR
jgi:hypothetical protein